MVSFGPLECTDQSVQFVPFIVGVSQAAVGSMCVVCQLDGSDLEVRASGRANKLFQMSPPMIPESFPTEKFPFTESTEKKHELQMCNASFLNEYYRKNAYF